MCISVYTLFCTEEYNSKCAFLKKQFACKRKRKLSYWFTYPLNVYYVVYIVDDEEQFSSQSKAIHCIWYPIVSVHTHTLTVTF